MIQRRIFARSGSVAAKHHRRFGSSRESGVTFIELLIAIVILLVGMLACLEFMTISIAASVNSQKVVIAKNLAQDTMEQIFVMRDMNAIGGLPLANARDVSTYPMLNNAAQGGIFPDGFKEIYTNAGNDLIRGTNDDASYVGNTIDPRYVGYQLRILVRSTAACGNDDPSTCPVPAATDQNKRVIIEVKFPFLRTKRTFTTRLETYMTIPPSQTRTT